MTDLGVMKYFLGIEVMQSNCGIFICQQKYASDVMKRFKMEECKPVDTPMTTNLKLSKEDDAVKLDESMYRSLIGSLMYLTASRPDILFAVKRVFRYIKGTINLGIFFPKSAGETLKLMGYSDSDWGGCVDDSKRYLRVFVLYGIWIFHLDFKKTRNNCPINGRSIVHCYCLCCKPSLMVKENAESFGV